MIWNEQGRPKHITKMLLDSLAPAIAAESNKFANVSRVSPIAILNHFRTIAIDALKSYNPNKGAAVATHVISRLRKGRRFVYSTQNIGRIPEHKILKIREYMDGVHGLKRLYGERPSTEEVAKFIGWKVKDVRRMEKELRADIPASAFAADPGVLTPSAGLEALKTIRAELTPGEKRVLDALLRKQDIRGRSKQVADELGVSEAYVSKTKKRIEQKLLAVWRPVEG